MKCYTHELISLDIKNERLKEELKLIRQKAIKEWIENNQGFF